MSRTLAKIPLNLPNGLTLSRVFLIAPLLWLLEAQLFFGAYVLASWVFLTDFLDGRLARANGQTSPALKNGWGWMPPKASGSSGSTPYKKSAT